MKKSSNAQTSMFEAFAEAEFDEKTAHMPSAIDEAIPFYRSIIDRYNTAILSGRPEVAATIEQEARDLAIRLNGGTPCGIKGDPQTAICSVLERSTSAPQKEVPLWGQTGDFTLEVCSCRIRIEFCGLYGICIPQFSIHAIDYDRPFISETGFRSFMGYGFDCSVGAVSVESYVRTTIEEYIARDLKSRLVRIEDRYCRLHAEHTVEVPKT
jgi:hypothetical protein